MSKEGSGSGGSIGNSNRTIKDLADDIRARALSVMSGAQFAKKCMAFDAQIKSSNSYVQYIEVLHRFIADSKSDAKQAITTMQLAMVWLDGHGHGERSIEHLAYDLKRIRDTK